MLRPSDINSLRRWNAIWLALLLLTWMGLGFNWFLHSTVERTLSPQVSQHPNGDLTIYASQDGPFVITHLMTYGENEDGKRVAALDPPVAYIDSRGVTIPAAKIKKLVWLNTWGERKPPPRAGAIIHILYLRPEKDRL